MKIGEKKVIKYSIVGIVWLIMISTFPSGSYLSKVALSIPSYFAVLFGAYAFLKIGFRLATVPEFPGEQDKLREDVERAKEHYKKKGVDIV